MTWAEVAHSIFRRNEMWLRENLPADFPRPSAVYGLFHAEAVELWAKRHWGLINDQATKEDRQAAIRERLRAGEGSISRQQAAEGARAPSLAAGAPPGRRRVP